MLLRGVRDGVKICPLIFVVGMIDLRRKKLQGLGWMESEGVAWSDTLAKRQKRTESYLILCATVERQVLKLNVVILFFWVQKVLFLDFFCEGNDCLFFLR